MQEESFPRSRGTITSVKSECMYMGDGAGSDFLNYFFLSETNSPIAVNYMYKKGGVNSMKSNIGCKSDFNLFQQKVGGASSTDSKP